MGLHHQMDDYGMEMEEEDEEEMDFQQNSYNPLRHK